MEKINRLKKIFNYEKIDGYLIPKNDQFFGEFVPDFNDRLNFISNFSGSYGFCLILKNKNYLFVDGRYTQQAINECGKYFNIITIPKTMPKQILRNKKLIIGYDPKLFTKSTFNIFFSKNNCEFKPINQNLIDKIWIRKKEKKRKKFFILPKVSTGESYESKVNKISLNLKNKSADYQLITASENNAWLLNIRGKDAEYTPIPNSYILLDKFKNIYFFCDLKKISNNFRNFFKKIKFYELDDIEKILSNISKKKFLIDELSCSLYFEKIILKNNKVTSSQDPIYYFKSIKNKKEIENIKKAHILDGVALTKYLFWIKKNFSKKKISEISASSKLLNFRKKNKDFKFLSFPTISGVGPNGAIIHYRATKKTNRILKKGEIYLVDSGGQYEFGTTDVTRTISLENSNKNIKNIFTRVLKGHIAVTNYKLVHNTSGSKLDNLARKYLKEIGLNFPHGTGHGVGYFLNVHEGPQAITKSNKVKFEEGMVVSNEPGYYKVNKFGIRIENLIYVKKQKNVKIFEDLTMVPIDKELIEENNLNNNEKKWLNEYHKKVYKSLKNSMNKNEINQLKEACSAI